MADSTMIACPEHGPMRYTVRSGALVDVRCEVCDRRPIDLAAERAVNRVVTFVRPETSMTGHPDPRPLADRVQQWLHEHSAAIARAKARELERRLWDALLATRPDRRATVHLVEQDGIPGRAVACRIPGVADIIEAQARAAAYDESTPYRVLAPGYGLWVQPMIFTHRIVVGTIGSGFVDDAWCYHTREAAEAAADAWDPTVDPEPDGWHRHPRTGRRREVPRG